MPPEAIIARIGSLIARTESSYEEEARTSALLAIRLMRKHGMLPEELMRQLAKMARKPMKVTSFAQKGGRARAASLTQKRRSEIARNAAHARWHKKSTSLLADTSDT